MLDDVQPVDITPEQFERQVRDWLQASADGLQSLRVTHLRKVEGDSGEYEIDVMAEFEVFGGALVKVLVECKRYKNPVKRDVVMVLESKIRDTSAHKGMVFSTSGFQKGAIEFAQNRGIATVTLQHGNTNYFTASKWSGPVTPPPWLPRSEYIGWFMTLSDEGSRSFSLIDDDRKDPLIEWCATHIEA